MTAQQMPSAVTLGDDQATRLRRILGDRPADRAGAASSAAAWSACHACATRPATIVVASGKGGVGKSVLSLSIAAWIAKRASTTLLDADFGAANLDVMLGVAPLRRLDEAFEMGFAPGHRPADLAINVTPGLRLVPGVIGARHRPDQRQRAAMIKALDDFEPISRVLVIDAAAGVDGSVTDMLAIADCPLIITTPEPTAIADAYALLKSLARQNGGEAASRAMLAVNLVRQTKQAERVYRRIAAVSDRFLGFRPALAGIVPWDKRVPDGVVAQRPIALGKGRSPSLKAVAGVAAGAFSTAEYAHRLRTCIR